MQLESIHKSPTPAFLALLASHIRSGIILCCGESLKDYCDVISRSMPMMTKLVLNVETPEARLDAEILPAYDIRIAVHQQEYLSFLNDISRYFFDLILLEDNQNLATMIEGLLDKLMPGGMIVVLHADVEKISNILPEPGWHIVDTSWPDHAILIREESEDSQPKRRKGGRRAKLKAQSSSN